MQENNGNNQKQGGLSWSTPSSAQSTPAQKPAAAPAKMPTPPMKSNTPAPMGQGGAPAKYVSMVIVGVIVGALIAWGYSAMHSSKMAAGTDTGTMATSTDTTSTNSGTGLGADTAGMVGLGSDPSFTIPSPQAAGTSVAISKAVVSAPTWVVIYEDNNGKPGNALGAGLFFPDHQAGTVELLRSTTPGKSYLAVKQTDNGDRKFSLKDDQYLTENGTVQWVTFQAQ